MRSKLSKEELEYLDKNPRSIMCLETRALFKNPNQAEVLMDLPFTSVIAFVRGRRKLPINGFTFEYLERMKGSR